jgi:isocitrate/isopropylmalate dehydrogenase
VAAILCVGLLLEHLGQDALAAELEAAVVDAFREGITTPDLGGTRGTTEVGEWIADRLEVRLAKL